MTTLSTVYNISSKKNLRNISYQGYNRPTIKEAFMSVPDYEAIPPIFIDSVSSSNIIVNESCYMKICRLTDTKICSIRVSAVSLTTYYAAYINIIDINADDSITVSEDYVFTAMCYGGLIDVIPINSTKVVILYSIKTSLEARVVTIGEGSVTFGTAQSIFSGTSLMGPMNGLLIDTDKIVVIFRDTNGISTIASYGVIFNISGTTISSYGSPEIYDVDFTRRARLVKLTNNKAIMVYHDFGNNSLITSMIVYVNENVISFGSPTVLNDGVTGALLFPSELSDTKVVIGYGEVGIGDKISVFSISDLDAVTNKHEYRFSDSTDGPLAGIKLDNDHTLIVWTEIGPDSFLRSMAAICVINNTTIKIIDKTNVNPVQGADGNISGINFTFLLKLSNTKCALLYRDSTAVAMKLRIINLLV